MIQSNILSDTEGNNNIYFLNMGKPIKILDIAKKMIKLSGLQLIDEKNQNGDIKIKFIGLRSGEKLYEELVKDSNYSLSTHPLIYKCKEKVLDYNIYYYLQYLMKLYKI